MSDESPSLNLLIYQRPTTLAGLGHSVRCRVLANEAIGRGHNVITRVQDPDRLPDMREAIEGYGFVPDWLVVDVPGELPDEPFEAAKEWGARVCLLNGVGYEQDDPRADLTVVQGLADAEYSGPDYVLLRPRLFTYARWPSPTWLVYGGARDDIQLVRAFQTACRDRPAWLVRDVMTPPFLDTKGTPHQAVEPGGGVMALMAEARAACVQMGMVTWELATLRIPAYVFSHTPAHLEFAHRMAAAGLIAAWPEVGIPPAAELRAFLEEPFEMTGEPPDGGAAGRIVELLEGWDA